MVIFFCCVLFCHTFSGVDKFILDANLTKISNLLNEQMCVRAWTDKCSELNQSAVLLAFSIDLLLAAPIKLVSIEQC